MYKNGQELLDLCEKENKRVWEIALDAETKLTGMERERLWAHFETRLDVMIGSATKALEHRQATKGGLVDGVANCQYEYSKKDGSVTGNYMNYIMALAYSSSEVNASMGKICASPTAGSCGILPAVLVGMMNKEGFAKEEIIKALKFSLFCKIFKH